MENSYSATGRRKRASARVTVRPGNGKIWINGHSLRQYIKIDTLIQDLEQPLVVTDLKSKVDVDATVKGGGIAGQTGAIRHGIARTLDKLSSEYHTPLKRAGLLTRDSRIKERKKYGLKKARKAPQFSKR